MVSTLLLLTALSRAECVAGATLTVYGPHRAAWVSRATRLAPDLRLALGPDGVVPAASAGPQWVWIEGEFADSVSIRDASPPPVFGEPPSPEEFTAEVDLVILATGPRRFEVLSTRVIVSPWLPNWSLVTSSPAVEWWSSNDLVERVRTAREVGCAEATRRATPG